MVEFSEVLCPNEFGTVPHSSTIDGSLFEYGAVTAGSRVFLSVSFAEKCIEGTVPSTVVVAHTVVGGKARDERSEGDTFVVVETRGSGVFIEPEACFWVILASVEQSVVTLHHADGVESVRPDISAKADDEHATIFVVHRHELGKELQA